MKTTQWRYVLFWTNPGSKSQQNCSCIVTNLHHENDLSQKRHARHFRWNKEELISDIFLRTPIYVRSVLRQLNINVNEFFAHTRQVTKNDGW